MRSAGDVTYASIMSSPNGRSKGCGLVEFSDAIGARRAIEELNDTDLKGRIIFVREDREVGDSKSSSQHNHGGAGTGSSSHPRGAAPSSGSQSNNNSNTSVYVGNLNFDCSWQDLKDHMRTSGNVQTADILTGSDGRSKGCGIVVYQNVRGKERAIRELQNTVINGRPIFVREDREVGKGNVNCGVYVGNLPYEATWKELKDAFGRIGSIERADVTVDVNGKSKGWGIVKFHRAQDAAKAVRVGGSVGGRKCVVRFDKGKVGR